MACPPCVEDASTRCQGPVTACVAPSTMPSRHAAGEEEPNAPAAAGSPPSVAGMPARRASLSFLAADFDSPRRSTVSSSGFATTARARSPLTREEVLALEDEVEQLILGACEETFASKFIAESPHKLRRIVRRFREHLGELPPVSPLCNAPWVSTCG